SPRTVPGRRSGLERGGEPAALPRHVRRRRGRRPHRRGRRGEEAPPLAMAALADAALRRLLDVTVAGTLLIALSPLLAVLALLVPATSPGPALFRQTRIGRDGRPFALLKLRTMRADAVCTGPAITAGEDPRITPLGARLRRVKLDELPQLWNVLC